MIGRRIQDCTFVVVDVETTGIDASRDRVVEIAILTCDWTAAVLERFETLIRPDDVALTGTRAEMLAEAPTLAEVAGEIVGRLAGGVVAGHNVSFDLRFIDAELNRLGVRLPTHGYVCTRELATLLGCDVANRTLAALCVYCGVPFDRWHVAADDTAATAAVLASLLGRAVGFGRVELASVESRWSGFGSDWPVLPSGGRVLVRDSARWPPVGDQPGSRRAKEASFRRLGEGPSSPSGARMISETEPEEATSASELWWQGDFRGLAGIDQLQMVVLPAFRANDDPELVEALLALADLLRRHGGRDAEVRATLAEAYDAAARRGTALDELVEQWWTYLTALRDVDGQVQLMLRCLDTAGGGLRDPVDRIAATVASTRGTEPVVAERLARSAMAALSARGDQARAWDVLAALVETLEFIGRDREATALIEQAWAGGCDSVVVLDRLSRRLERNGEYGRAVDVCTRALSGRPARQRQLLDTLRKRHRRCQERLAQEAKLFG